jgi:ubiquinone/menaquinone biosynthesis C-methylase UbiE
MRRAGASRHTCSLGNQVQNSNSLSSIFSTFELSEVEQKRYQDLRAAFEPFRARIEGKRVLDFGASYGLSGVVLIEFGASFVFGVEPEKWRVEKGREFIDRLGLTGQIELVHVSDTSSLEVDDSSFSFILANAVFEHIPQPRDAYVRELWRVLSPGGTLLIRETPNKYLPVDFHTLHLPLTNWLPSPVSRKLGVLLKRFDPKRKDWAFSGWRGMGHYELVNAIPGPYVLEHEMTRPRHRVLRAAGLPSGLLDPYPVYLVRKP